MALEIRLSGSIEVWAAGQRGELRSIKTRLTLAALAWDAGRTVSMESLVHRVWDDHPPKKARESLHVHISRVRHALSIAGSDAPEIASLTNSYVLNVDPELVDLCHYTACVNRGRSLRDSRDDEAALRILERADGLWRGEALAGIGGTWADQLRAAVTETCLAAAMARADILISRERYVDAIPVLTPLVHRHPVDEALTERLAIALYGGSRAAEAARLLHATQQRIARDTGLDAGRRLRRVQQAILAGAPAAELIQRRSAGLARSAELARPRAPHPVPDNLPRDVPWVGRRDELCRLGSALTEGGGAAAMVVTVEAINGMGGVGKTSLAVHVAHQLRERFPDGRIFLHLGGRAPGRAAPQPARLLTELLRLLGMDVKELPHTLDELVALWRGLARDRRMLVILDDAADSDQVRPLLPGGSPTAVIVTSRRRLPGLPGVRALSLGVLSQTDAMELFHQRVGARPDAKEGEVAEIVRICGYLPLAVEIAASRLLARSSWSTGDLLRQLTGSGRYLAELRDGERSIAHVFEMSYRALSGEQQRVFRRIGLLGGVDFGAPAVAAVTGFSLAVTERVVEELLVQHLLSEPTPHRFTMHDLLRRYARSLMESGEVESREESERAVRDVVAYYVGAADAADRLAYPYRSRMECDLSAVLAADLEVTDAQTAEQWLITEGPNLLDALNWVVQHGTGCQLPMVVHVLAGFLGMEGHLATAEPLLRQAVAYWDAEGDGAARTRAMLDLSVIHNHGSRYEESIAVAREALESARFLKDAKLEGESAHQLSISLWQTGQYASSQALQQRSVESMLRTGDAFQIARSRNMLGIVHLHMAELDESLECFLEALAAFNSMGHTQGKCVVLNNVAELHGKAGRPVAAERAYRDVLEIVERSGSRRYRAVVQMNLARTLVSLGEADEALSLCRKSLPVLREIGDQRSEAIALNSIALAHRLAGHGERALQLHTEALMLARRIRAAGEEIEVLYDLACTEQLLGLVELAVGHLEESLSVSRRIGAPVEAERAANALTALRQFLGTPQELER
ncbi:tetratricopeptide repeat protein [Streptomyces sp. HSW2009]|uniref:AfsR/SARP family transcriptional regulator n=1 Tax=Streptomyces sp. HSW2009 TaxID=3142890 RepID=UPI0032EE4A75